MKVITESITRLILDDINSIFDEDNYPEFNKPYEISGAIVLFWDCGGIILYGRSFQTFSEDDGHWFISSNPEICFSSGWLEKFTSCMLAANNYLKENGVPFYYQGTNIICGYEIISPEDKENNQN